MVTSRDTWLLCGPELVTPPSPFPASHVGHWGHVYVTASLGGSADRLDRDGWMDGNLAETLSPDAWCVWVTSRSRPYQLKAWARKRGHLCRKPSCNAHALGLRAGCQVCL